MKKAEITKQLILTKTLELLRLNGNVTVKAIASSANVNIAAINYHFQDKHTLISIIIKNLVGGLKDIVQNFINSSVISNNNLATMSRQFIDAIYNYTFTNIGVIKHILIPSNKDTLNETSKLFLDIFAMDSELTTQIVNKLGEIVPNKTNDELKIKYVLLFSAFCFPLIFQLNINDIDATSIFSIREGGLQEKYVDELVKILVS